MKIDIAKDWAGQLDRTPVGTGYQDWLKAVVLSRDVGAARIGFSNGSTGSLPASGAAMTNGDDVTVADEDGGFAIFDRLAVEPRGPRDHEELVAEDFDLRKLVGVDRVLDSERMQFIAALKRSHFFRGRIDDSDPDELRPVLRAVDLLVDRDASDTRPITIMESCDDRHCGPLQRRGPF